MLFVSLIRAPEIAELKLLWTKAHWSNGIVLGKLERLELCEMGLGSSLGYGSDCLKTQFSDPSELYSAVSIVVSHLAQ